MNLNRGMAESLIITLIHHPRFGYLLQPVFASFRPETDVYTITEAAGSSSSSFPLLDNEAQKIVTYAERYSDKNLMISFSREKSEAAFLQKVADSDINNYIRPFIENRHREIMELIVKANTPLFIREKMRIRDFRPNQALEVMSEPSKMVFIFRNRETFTYTAKVQNGKSEITLYEQFFAPLVSNPALVVIGRQLHHFSDVDEKKLRPFFSKKQIDVPANSVTDYIRKFVVQCVKNYETIGEGLTIFEQKQQPIAVLTLENGFDLLPVLHLRFQYGNNHFAIDKPYKKEVELHEEDGEISIGWYYRDRDWEEKQIRMLTDAGLWKTRTGQFVTEAMRKNSLNLSDNTDEQRSFSFGVVEWLNRNGDLLKNFKLEQSFGTRLYYTGEISVQMDISDSRDWFDIQCVACFGAERIPFIRFKNHILQGIHEYVLPDGRIAVLPTEWFARFTEMFRFGIASGDNIRLKKYHFRVKELAENGFLTPNGEERTGGAVEIPKSLNAVLRPYQQSGFRWLVYLQERGFGGCLADDMGLGKTLQTIALLLHTYTDVSLSDMPKTAHKVPRQLSLFDDGCFPTTMPDRDDDAEENAHDKTEVNANAEADGNIKDGAAVSAEKEAEGLGSGKAGGFQVAVKEGIPPSLIVMPTSLIHNWLHELEKFAPSLNVYVHAGSNRLRGDDFEKSITGCQIILTSYGIVRQDIYFLSHYPFHYLILDESQYIKNPSSQIFSSVKQLSSTYKLALTGTPVENSLSDLWAQMDFLNDHILGKQGEFKMRFRESDVVNDEAERQTLLKIIDPFILRRSKDEVAPELPPLTDEIIYCEMEDEQALLYNEEKNKIRNMLLEQSAKDNRLFGTAALSGLMRLRHFANHPAISVPDYEGTSAKSDQIMAQADILFSENHKVLIFSSFVKHLQIIAGLFDDRGWRYAWLTGSTVNREEVIDQFNSDENVRAFFISLKAGGTGLNLTAADYVFIIDPWWNPAAEMQAVSRAHRIGQDRKVTLYRFITKDSVEEKIQRLQQYKKTLTDALVRPQLSMKEIEDLLV